MKKIILFVAFIAITTITFSQASPCETAYNESAMQQSDPARYQRFMQLETFTQQYINGNNNGSAQRLVNQNGIITIPVVVHIIHNGEPLGSGRNISDALIQSQIDVLNEDYMRLNADRINTPSAFATVAGVPNFQFALACTDPNGNPTNGIRRIYSTTAKFSYSRDYDQNGIGTLNDTTKRYSPSNYQIGDTNNAQVDCSIYGKYTVGGIHTHPLGQAGYAPGPSPRDLYHLIECYLLNNPNFKHDFVLGASGNDWAISVTDSADAALYLQAHPHNTTVNDTNNRWLSTAALSSGVNIYKAWERLIVFLHTTMNYPDEMCQTYANIVLLDNYLNGGIPWAGVSFFIKDKDDKFRKLSSTISYDALGNINKIEIKICQY